ESFRLRNCAPQMVFDNKRFGFRVREKLQMFRGSKFVIKRHENAAAMKNGVSRNQPLRLIRHDDRGPRVGRKSRVLQRTGERQRSCFELPVGQAAIFAVAVGFDEANFIGPAFKRGAQGCAQLGIMPEVEQNKRAWMRAASVRKSLTPWSS